MIVGKGNISSVLKDREDRIYFASGVSFSGETRESEFRREIDLLMKQDRFSHLVYFSSLCVFYSYTPYARHKRLMERLVKGIFERYTIVRLGNIEWDENPHTLINYLRARKERGEPLVVQDVYRYVISKEEFLHWINMIPPWSCEMNLPGRMMKVSEIVEKYVEES